MKKILLILSVALAVTGEQGKLTVVLFPNYGSLYVGDEVTFRCKNGNPGNVKWKFNNTDVPFKNDVLYKPTVTKDDAGKYECESDGKKGELYVTVKDMVPPALLTIRDGSLSDYSAVIGKTGSVRLMLFVEKGLHNWMCYFTAHNSIYEFELDVDNWINNRTMYMLTYELKDSKNSVYWCMNSGTEKKLRSNIIRLTATGQIVSLQFSENPAINGENVSLLCLVWGGPQMYNIVFRKEGQIVQNSASSTYVIQNVGLNRKYVYSCTATFAYTHIHRDAAKHVYTSDNQTLLVIGGPPAATLEKISGKLHCLCKSCSSHTFYRWYHEGNPLLQKGSTTEFEPRQQLEPQEAGHYTCRAVLDLGLSRPSNRLFSGASAPPETNGTSWLLLLGVVLGVMLFVGLPPVCILCKICRDKRERKRKKLEEGGYEELKMKGATYDTLGAPEKKKVGDGEYEALNTKEATYHTLKGEAEKKEGGGGEYEALNTKEATYHTLKGEAEKKEGGGGEYEALTTKEATYHTLKGEAEKKEGGGGEYEALTTKEATYHTLKVDPSKEGEAEGGYQALKLSHEEKEKQEYQTLKGQSKEKEQYQTLQNVQAEVYNTIKQQNTEGGVGKKGEGQGEGGYEQLPLKETVADEKPEENPYEELKAGQQEKQKSIKGKK